MAQYIQAPDFSYEPLPMQAYMQLAEKVAAGYAEGINSANAYLASLPIASGALDDPNGDRAAKFRNEYGNKVENAIQLYMDTKDKRSLASALTNITREMQSDEQLLSHNYLAANSDNILKRHQENPNGWFGYTKDGTSTLYTVDENGNRVSNLVSPTEVEGLGAAKNFYGNFLSGFDIAKDTKWIDNYGKSIEKFKSQYGVTDPATGKTTYQVAGQSYSNVLDAYKGGATQEFRDSVSAVYDTGSNAMARLYRERYGYEEGKQKFIEDTFRYRLPMEYGSETGFVDVAPSAGATSTTTSVNTTPYTSVDAFSNVYSLNKEVLSPRDSNYVSEVLKEAEERMQDGRFTTVDQMLENDPQFSERYQLASDILMYQDIERTYNQSETGIANRRAKEEEMATIVSDDQSGIMERAASLGLSALDLNEFRHLLELDDIGLSQPLGSPVAFGDQLLKGQFLVPDEDTRSYMAAVANGDIALMPDDVLFGLTPGTGNATTINLQQYLYGTQYRNPETGELESATAAERLQNLENAGVSFETLGPNELVDRGYLDLDNPKHVKFLQLAKSLDPNTAGGGAMLNLFEGQVGPDGEIVYDFDKLKLANSPNVGLMSSYPLAGQSTQGTPALMVTPGLYLDGQLRTAERETSDSDYNRDLEDLISSANIASGEVFIQPSVEMETVMSGYDNALAQELGALTITEDEGDELTDRFFAQYDVIKLGADASDAEGTAYSRQGAVRITKDEQDLVTELRGKAVTVTGTGATRNNVNITGYTIPNNSNLKAGLTFTAGVGSEATSYMLVPKDPNNQRYLQWLNDPRTSLTGKRVTPLIESGPFGGLYSMTALQYANRQNAIREAGIIRALPSTQEALERRLSQLTGSGGFPGFLNENLRGAFITRELDLSNAAQLIDDPEFKDLNVNLGYLFVDKDSNAFTWDKYFEGEDKDSYISSREAQYILRSQEATNDLDPRNVSKAIRSLKENIQSIQGNDGNRYGVIKRSDFESLFEENMGVPIDYSRGIFLTNPVDAVDFYGFNTSQYHIKK